MTEVTDWAVVDLVWTVRLGRERLADVLDDVELAVCAQLEALGEDWGHLYARLVSRKPAVFFVPDVEPQIEVDVAGCAQVLVDRGLADDLVSWPERVGAVTHPVLTEWCRALGLPATGRLADKRARLEQSEGVNARGPWVRPLHTGLVRLLQQAAFLDKRADARSLVVERLGLVRWPEYTPTGGPVLFRDRAHRIAWQGLWRGLQAGLVTPEMALEALRNRGGQCVGRLSLERALRRLVLEHIEAVRVDSPLDALGWLERLRGALGLDETAYALVASRIWEAHGDAGEALSVLARARRVPDREARLAVHRSGRRLAAAQATAWVPDPPLRKAKRRTVYIERVAGTGARSTWRVGEAEHTVEEAVVRRLAEHGRVAVHAEGGLIRTLAALLFAEAAFLPIPGSLPVPHLSGPLDVGTRHFAEARKEAVAEVLGEVDAGLAPQRIAEACQRWHGVRLSGVSRDLSDPAPLVAVAESLGGAGLRAVLRPLLARGWSAAKGLPDLLVLAGEPARLDAAHPKRVPTGALWVEVKGPGDTLRDSQRVWIDHLVGAGGQVELWSVSPPS